MLNKPLLKYRQNQILMSQVCRVFVSWCRV